LKNGAISTLKSCHPCHWAVSAGSAAQSEELQKLSEEVQRHKDWRVLFFVPKATDDEDIDICLVYTI